MSPWRNRQDGQGLATWIVVSLGLGLVVTVSADLWMMTGR